MKIFISWSGDASRDIAIALEKWLRRMIQAAQPFISTDIEKGKRWSVEIGNELSNTDFGIIVLTPDNLKEGWILFEAGALSKRIADGRVCTFLTGGLEANAVSRPLSQFQHTLATKSDVLKLLQAINKLLPAPLAVEDIDESLGLRWPNSRRRLRERWNQAQLRSRPNGNRKISSTKY